MRLWQTAPVLPRVSVVVPVYNGMAHLGETVESILSQTYPELEIVLVDGGSGDGSLAWLHRIDDPRVRIMEMPVGTTAAGNWTAASEAATGDFVKLVCQDDVLYPDAISHQVADLVAAPGAVMAIARRDIIDAHGRVIIANQGASGLPAGRMPGARAIHRAYQVGTNILSEPVAVMFRREALIPRLPWNDREPLMLDLEMYDRVLQGGDVIVRHESIGAFRVSSSSWSTRLAAEQVRQFRNWQTGYESRQGRTVSGSDRVRARVGVHYRAALRRGAYAWLAARGAFRSPEMSSGE